MRRSWNNFASARHGMTLVEVMIAVAVMTTMLVASLGAAGGAARSRLAQRESAIGLSLARQLLSEIMQTRYADLQNPVFGIEAGETRATFDDVDDYDGLIENSAAYADGTPIPGGVRWRRQVSVKFVTAASPTTTSSTDTGLKRIVVTVTSPTGRVFSISALRSSSNGYENTPGSQTTYVSWVGVMLQVGGSDAGRSEQGANLVNEIP